MVAVVAVVSVVARGGRDDRGGRDACDGLVAVTSRGRAATPRLSPAIATSMIPKRFIVLLPELEGLFLCGPQQRAR